MKITLHIQLIFFLLSIFLTAPVCAKSTYQPLAKKKSHSKTTSNAITVKVEHESTSIWTIVSAIATLCLAVYAILQVKLLRLDLRESKSSRNANIVLYVVSFMDGLRKDWHKLYELPEDYTTWNTEQKKLADSVCVGLQRMAYLAESDLFDETYLYENYAGVFCNCWKVLEGFIQNYRKKCGEAPTIEDGAFQRRHFELFTRKCQKYLDQKFPKTNGTC